MAASFPDFYSLLYCCRATWRVWAACCRLAGAVATDTKVTSGNAPTQRRPAATYMHSMLRCVTVKSCKTLKLNVMLNHNFNIKPLKKLQ